jgi:uncharacterized radical SAM superfamily protein
MVEPPSSKQHKNWERSLVSLQLSAENQSLLLISLRGECYVYSISFLLSGGEHMTIFFDLKSQQEELKEAKANRTLRIPAHQYEASCEAV